MQPPKGAVPEAHTVGTYQVPEAFYKYAFRQGNLSSSS